MSLPLRFLLPLALVLLLGAAPALAQPAPGANRPAAGARSPRAERTLWWNNAEVIEKLSLTNEQRKKMDEAYAAFEARLEKRAKAGATRNSFQAALEAGRFDDARKDLKSMSAAAGVPAEAMGELKIATLEQLTDEQRATLKEEYPMLVRQQWSPRPSWATRRRPQGQRPGGGPGPS